MVEEPLEELEEAEEVAAEAGEGEGAPVKVVAAVAVRCPHHERLDAIVVVFEDGSMEFACPLDVANECDYECPYRVLM